MNLIKQALGCCLLLVVLQNSFVPSISAQTPNASPASSTLTAQQLAVKVDEYMNAAAKAEGFSGSILVARDGSTVASKGYGLANIELNVPNTPQTVFRLASLTKQFTALAIMMLQERGKLSTGDSICKYLDACPATWQPITIRQLLTHTSGIPNYTSFPDFARTAVLPATHESFIGRVKDRPLDFVAGEKFNYSNTGYYLLGVVVERAAGKSYEDFVQENIFTPLGMKNTGFDNPVRIIKNRAAGYEGQGERIHNASYIDMSNGYAAGFIVSTTEDLLLWDKALYTERLVSRKSLDEMFTPFKDLSPTKNYAYAWWLEKQSDRQAISHSGHINGFATYIMRYPAERVTVIVLSNNRGAPSERVAKDLSAIAFGAPYKIPQERKVIAVASAVLEKYAGQYQLRPNFIITMSLDNGKLLMQPNAPQKVEMFATSETEFFLKAGNAQFTFLKDAQGTVTGLIFHLNGQETTAPKIK
ncbi:MAG TPA: serine hydrolase [Pyrinomonadaceae bacterium]|jgi:CubicO group peptidase (beta-lactamase class C family)